MIIRLWLVSGVVLAALAWILQVPLAPKPFQASASSAISDYRKAGMIPPVGAMKTSTAIGHDVFEIPETDARHAAEEAVMGGMPGMPGTKKDGQMDMPGMKKEDEHAAMPDMKMPDEHAAMPGMKMPDEQSEMPGMKMPDEQSEMPGMTKDEHAAMPGMKEDGDLAAMPGMKKEVEQSEMPGMKKEDEHGGMPGMKEEEAGGHGGGGMAVGMTVLAQGNATKVAAAVAGTKISRTVEIRMVEWGFEPRSIMVKPGEVIHLKVRNTGNIPHEFMFMPMAGMRAVTYRIERADWNLTEHEAISEQSLVLPGDGFEQVVRIEKPGMWMYMCMFPYHMRFGMMGAMLTEGMEGMMMMGDGKM